MWPSLAKWEKLHVEASRSLAFHSAQATPSAKASIASFPLQPVEWEILPVLQSYAKGEGTVPS